MIVHHHGKPAQNSDREAFQLKRGSSALDDFRDSYLTLTRYRKEQGAHQRLSFTLRNAEQPEDLILCRNPEGLWYEVVAEPDPGRKVTVQNVIHALMYLGGRAKRRELIDRLVKVCEAGKRTVISTIKEAHELGRIEKRQQGSEVEYFFE